MFFNNRQINFIISNSLSVAFLKSNSMSTIYKWPIVSSKLTDSNKKLNVFQEMSSLSLIQPVGNGLVIPLPYWLFSSSFKILVIPFFWLFHYSFLNCKQPCNYNLYPSDYFLNRLYFLNLATKFENQKLILCLHS